MKKLYIGADPELFLQDVVAGHLISAIGKIGGTKQEPLPVKELGEGYAVQEDNVALEYNIPPADSPEQLKEHINKMMGYIHSLVSKQGLSVNTESACIFPRSQLADPRALEFGCDPDFNAWTLAVNPRPKAANKALRSCGGHVHVGCGQDLNVPEAVKRLDLTLAVPSVLMDNGQLRKQLYGKAGAFRGKPYGFEYRVLSNFWIFREDYIEWVFNNTQLGLSLLELDISEDADNIVNAVNNNDKNLAQMLINKYQLPTIYA